MNEERFRGQVIRSGVSARRVRMTRSVWGALIVGVMASTIGMVPATAAPEQPGVVDGTDRAQAVSTRTGVPDVTVGSVTEVGVLTRTPGIVFGGDVAASTRLAGRVHWVFGDTLFARTSGQPAHPADDWRSATHATASLDNPWSLTNVMSVSTGVPTQLLPYTREESAYNRNSANPNHRYALWPSSIVAGGRDTGHIVYAKVLIKPGELNYHTVGVGIATLRAGANTARRDFSRDATGLVFHDGDPNFGASGAVLDRDHSHLYLYECRVRATFDYPCRLARVSVRTETGMADWSRVGVRANYQAAVRQPDGTVNWTSQLDQANEVVNGSTTGWSVSWNASLGKYLAIYNVPLSNAVQMRTADRPEGPWSDPMDLFTGQEPSCWPGTQLCMDYALQQHPELATSTSTGSTLYLTYARGRYSPQTPYTADINVVRVTLNRPSSN